MNRVAEQLWQVLDIERIQKLFRRCGVARRRKSTNTCNVTDNGLWSLIPYKQLFKASIVIAFREPTIFLRHQQWDMNVSGMAQTKQFLQVELLRRRAQQVNTPYHVGNTLRRIIYNYGKLVRKSLIRTANKKITAVMS